MGNVNRKVHHSPVALVRTLMAFVLLQLKAYGQQNLFNIPSGDITPRGRFFYQHQLNVHRGYLESKGHLVYGLGRGWDGGLNLVGKGLFFSPAWREVYLRKPEGPRFDPTFMATLQKQWKLSGKIDLNAGLQAGANWGSGQKRSLRLFSYALALVHTGGGSRVVAGLYQSNEAFLGAGGTRGLMLGYEWKLSKRFYLMGDWKSGRNEAGAAVIGGMLNVSGRVQVCAGLLLPNPGSPKPPGLVLELNLLGWDLDGLERKN